MHMIFFQARITRISQKKNKENPCFPCNLYFRKIRVIRARKYTLLP